MKHIAYALGLVAAACASLVLFAQPQPPQEPPRQQQDIILRIEGPPGLPPKLAVPDFIPIGNDSDVVAAAKTIGEVLWDDLNFEREFYLIARDTYRSIPTPASIDQVPLDRWKELNADGVIVGTVRKAPPGIIVQVRLVQVATGTAAFGKEYSGSLNSIATDHGRIYAHTISDEVHLQQRGLPGVARTKLSFTSDRDGERINGPVGDRAISNIYISDYDGANQRRITATRGLDLSPVWFPDRKALAYTSYRTGYPDIIVAYLEQARHTTPAGGTAEKQNFLPAVSPDGTKVAFTSNRDGNSEIYIMNVDGTNMRRLTNHPAIDVAPTFSPPGNQIAFTSDRSGSAQIWIMGIDGSGVQQITRETKCDRATWSPAPFNEIAYTSQSGGGFDIRIFDFATRSTRTITDGIGSNEQPAFAPNGRHIAFNSTRSGKEQIFLIDRDGKNLKQVTRTGVNRYPNWSK